MEIDRYLAEGCEPPPIAGGDPLADLITQVSRRDHDAFTTLVMHTEPRIRHFFSRAGLQPAEQDDAIQETFLAIYRYAHTYQPDRRPLPWILSIAINASRSHFRHQSRLSRLLGTILPSFPGPTQAPSPESKVTARSTLTFLQTEAMRLPLVQRQVLGLAATSALTLAEIGQALGIPENTAKSHLRRARQSLAEALVKRDKGGVI